MPDPDPILEGYTGSNLIKARAVEAELKAEIAKAKSFGTNYTAYEIRLESVRSDIDKYLARNSQIETNQVAITNKSPSDKLADFVSAIASSPLGFLSAGMTAVQSAAGFLTGAAQVQKRATEIAREKSLRAQGTNSPNSTLTPAQPGIQSPTNNPPAPPIPPPPSSPANPAAPSLPDFPSRIPAIPSPTNNGDTNNNTQPAPASSSPTSAGDFTFSAAQTDALQSTGERMQAAFQQNALMTNSLFQQTLELIDSQNRKLGDVDRKISELSNQLKSLKNP